VPFLLFVVLLVGLAAAPFGVLRYRRHIREAKARLDSVDSQSAELDAGSVEYTDVGSGPCLLVSHGIFHGCDGGQRAARDVVSGHRVISPSRFGYLGSSMPDDSTGATQADSFIALLDHLGIETTAVMGISAGTSAAVQLALRHPERVTHLIVSSGNWPGSPTSVAPPGWAKVFYNDPAMWLLKAIAPPMTARLMGVPKGLPHDDEQAAYVQEMLNSIFPLEPRVKGAVFDAFSSNPEVNEYPLEEIAVPTLIIHAQDDPLASFDAAQKASTRIPNSRLVELDSGGHLGLGQTERVRDAIATFLVGADSPQFEEQG
jgi:pimeloyl-ACP methyl ester carboxylesterase